MKLKKFITIISLCFLLICCISAVSAVSDDNIDNSLADFGESQDTIAVGEDEAIGESDSDIISDSQKENVLGQGNDEKVSVDAGTVDYYEMFMNDLNSGVSNITVHGDFSIPETIYIDYDVVIEGNGHTIDGKKKFGIFESYNSLTIKNLVFKNGNADKGGAIFCKGNLIVDGCTFIGNHATIEGGAIGSSEGSLTVSNSKFESNTAPTSGNGGLGGAIWINGGVGKISTSTFTSNKAINGGAIYSNNQLTVNGCTFTSNVASENGGAIEDNGGSAKILKSTFTSNNADIAGAVYSNAKLTVDECNFNSNYASEYAGAVGDTRGSLTVSNSHFNKNTVKASSGFGGAIWTNNCPTTISKSTFTSGNANIGGAIYSNKKLTVDGCTFKSNHAEDYGGAIANTEGSITVKNSQFDKNTVPTKNGLGGAIWKNKGSATISKSTITNSKANIGGAVYCNSKLTVDGSTFTGNFAVKYGGAIGMLHGTLTVTGSNFNKNSVSNSGSAGYGGAIWIFDSKSSISKSKFTSNSCLSKSLKKHSKATKYKFSGGAIMYSAGSSHTLSGCTFTGNKASNHGGSIFVIKTKSLKISKSTFSKNNAKFEDGGAISFAGKKLTITSCNFNNNLAFEDGGAIDSYSVSGKVYVTVKNSKFTSNTGYKCAGAIWMGVKTVYKVSNSQFVKNKASSAGAIEAEDGSAKITKCLFKSNKAKKVTSWTVKTKSGGRLSHSGGAILVKNKCTVSKCKFKGNKAKYGKNIKVEGGKLKRK